MIQAVYSVLKTPHIWLIVALAAMTFGPDVPAWLAPYVLDLGKFSTGVAALMQQWGNLAAMVTPGVKQ